MKIRHFSFLLMLIFAAASLASCGGGGGAPGSSGSDDTGILIQSVVLSVDSDDIDVFQNPTACDGKPESPLTDALVTMNITAAIPPTNPDNPDPAFVSPFPANIESCSVSYISAVIGAPIIESKTIFPNCSFIDGTTSCTLDLLNIARKTQWWDDFSSGKFAPAEYPTKYTVVYSCKYQNSFKEEGRLGGRIDIDLADWLVCGG
jgi:hypothetical protein